MFIVAEMKVTFYGYSFRDGLKSTICNYIPRYANELGVPFANCLVIGGTGTACCTSDHLCCIRGGENNLLELIGSMYMDFLLCCNAL